MTTNSQYSDGMIPNKTFVTHIWLILLSLQKVFEWRWPRRSYEITFSNLFIISNGDDVKK